MAPNPDDLDRLRTDFTDHEREFASTRRECAVRLAVAETHITRMATAVETTVAELGKLGTRTALLEASHQMILDTMAQLGLQAEATRAAANTLERNVTKLAFAVLVSAAVGGGLMEAIKTWF